VADFSSNRWRKIETHVKRSSGHDTAIETVRAAQARPIVPVGMRHKKIAWVRRDPLERLDSDKEIQENQEKFL
jgi:hypothetical protein